MRIIEFAQTWLDNPTPQVETVRHDSCTQNTASLVESAKVSSAWLKISLYLRLRLYKCMGGNIASEDFPNRGVDLAQLEAKAHHNT